MLHQLLPPTVDNTYRGHPAALWLFGVLVFLKLVISVNSMVNGHSVASGADGIPLDTFATGAAQTVVSLFGLLGIATLILCVICIVVLVRYRALIPFMYAMLLLEFLATQRRDGDRCVLQIFLPAACRHDDRIERFCSCSRRIHRLLGGRGIGRGTYD